MSTLVGPTQTASVISMPHHGPYRFTTISRFLFSPPPEQSAQPPAFALGCQALLALTAWLRVLQGFAVLQSTHSLLAIARRLLSELLLPFLLVTGIITLGFAAAFHILIPRAAPVIAVGEDGDTLAAQPTYATGMLPMIVAASSAVLILLSLMLARSASIIQSIGTRGLAASTHLAFARVCIESRTKGLLPPPFNLLRVVVNWARNGLVNAMRKSEVAMEESSSWMWKRLTDIADDDESHQGGSEEEEERAPSGVLCVWRCRRRRRCNSMRYCGARSLRRV